MKTEQKIWIENIISTADSIQRMNADENLFAGVQRRLHTQVIQLQEVPTHTVWLAAAAVALLIALNFALLQSKVERQNSHRASLSLSHNNFDIYYN